MKKFFTGFLILNLLIETMAAVAMIGGAGGLIEAGEVMASIWTRNYGFAAFAIGSAVFWIWPYRENIQVVRAVMGILMTFHTGVAISLFMAGTQMGTSALHAVLAVLSIALYSQRARWCASA